MRLRWIFGFRLTVFDRAGQRAGCVLPQPLLRTVKTDRPVGGRPVACRWSIDQRSTINDRRCTGFTLIECLVAGMILAIFGSALIGGVMQAVNAGRVAEDQRLAAQFLDEAMSRVDYVGPLTMSTEGPFEGRFNERYAWRVQIDQADLSDLFTVTVTINWLDRGKHREVQAATQLFDAVGMRPLERRWEDLDG